MAWATRVPLAVLCATCLWTLEGVAQVEGSLPVAPANTSSDSTTGVWQAVKSEAKVYVSDGAALATAPLHWDTGDWERAAGFAVVVGGLLATDRSIDREAQKQRSPWTDRVSSATVRFGAEGAG